jgi:hypothetical protein
MIKRMAGLFLLLAAMFAVPTFGQNNTPTPQQPQATEEKLPISIVLLSDSDNPPTLAAEAVVKALTEELGDGYEISNTRPKKDDPTQFVIVIMAFGTTTVDKDGKTQQSSILAVSGKLHVKGHDFGYYLFAAPVQIETANQAIGLAEAVLDILGEADEAIAEDGGVDKL